MTWICRSIDVELFQASELYPNSSNKGLRALHERVMSSSSPDHHKYSVLYYLLKDFPQPKRLRVEDFAKAWYLPKKYKTFVDGVWYLDKLNFEVRVSSMLDDRLLLIPTAESIRFPDRSCAYTNVCGRDTIYTLQACTIQRRDSAYHVFPRFFTISFIK